MSDELIQVILDEATEQMAKAVEHAKQDFAGVRTGRASSGLVEKLPVEYYGSEVPMQQLASFSVPDARQLVITPFDKGAIEAIERAIRIADLGLSPSNDGVVMRLVFPPLTTERRREFVRHVKSMAEDGKVSIRNARRSGRQDLEELDKAGDASSDDVQRASKRLDEITHSHEAQIDESLAHKERELLED
jgi:ribosome recycling factor